MKKTDKLTISDFFTVRNDRGLHTRPATEIVKCAVGFKCKILLTYQNSEINAKSLLGILMFAATKGAKIGIKATGIDAAAAIESLKNLANNNFNIQY
jgi:phosphocarrier protein HPr